MDNKIKNKKSLIFGLFLFIFISCVYTYIVGVYYYNYISQSNVVKIHFSMFFISLVPMLIYFSIIIVIMLIDIKLVSSNSKIFKIIFKVLACVAALSFVFAIIGPQYMNDELISSGYTKCPKSSFRTSTVYVIDAELCRR
ncbi:TPA: DUF1240 domain-containing protein [Morganella morganii subsp. morganii]|nr:DUF1240 domain-containing protein [Morganella morganii subsp. morganii]